MVIDPGPVLMTIHGDEQQHWMALVVEVDGERVHLVDYLRDMEARLMEAIHRAAGLVAEDI